VVSTVPITLPPRFPSTIHPEALGKDQEAVSEPFSILIKDRIRSLYLEINEFSEIGSMGVNAATCLFRFAVIGLEASRFIHISST
jgi:hypothetical protein